METMESMETDADPQVGVAPNCQSLHQKLNEFRLTNILCDITIMDSNNVTTHAHSCILAAASPVLKSTIMLKDTNNMLRGQGVTLMIAGISVEVWKLLLEYLYLNTLVIPAIPGLLEEVLAAANMLAMKDLRHLIQTHIDSAGIMLGPTPENAALKITLAPTRPTHLESKGVQAGGLIVNSTKPRLYPVHRTSDLSIKQEMLTSQQSQPTTYQQVPASTLQSVIQSQPDPLQVSTPATSAVHDTHVVDANKSLRCRFCHMEFDRRAGLVEHVTDWCPNLNKPFIPADVKSGISAIAIDQSSNSNSSFVFESQGDGKIYKCINPKCGKFFKTSTALRRHAFDCILGTDTIRPLEQIQDLPDGTMVYRDDTPAQHLEEGALQEPLAYLDEKSRALVLKARVYNCAHCQFTGKRERVANHIAVHHGKRRPFSCRECGMRYGYYDSLRDHYIGVHTEAQFACTECGKVFKRDLMLRRHQLYEHTREGKALFPCKGCGKKFKNMAHARRHELYHNPGDQRRKHKCTECGKLFCTRQDLERHHDSVHSDARPYKCSRCPYSTPRKFYLSQHEKKHGIVNARYICMTCDKCFLSEQFFQAHLREKNHEGCDLLQQFSADNQAVTVQEPVAPQNQESVIMSQDGDALIVRQGPAEMTPEALETGTGQVDTVYYTYVTDQGNLSRVQSINMNQ